MSIYYWDFGFNFDAGTIKTGFVQAYSSSDVQNLTDQCTPTNNGPSWNFNEGDLVNFNIFDLESGGRQTRLMNAIIAFKSNDRYASPFGDASEINISPEAVGVEGQSAAFGGSYPHWMVSDQPYLVTNTGTFTFSVSLTIQSERVITTDPEMIVEGPVGD
jgi:hypothetical protein